MVNELVKDKSWSVYKSFMPNALQPKIMDMDRSIRAMNLGNYNKLVGTPTKLEERLYYKLYANNTANALRLKGEPTEYVLTSNENIRSCEDSVCTVFPAPETELDVKTHFEPVETPPATGDKSSDNPSTIKGWREIECIRCGGNLCKVVDMYNLVETDGVYTQVKEDNGLDGFVVQVRYLDGHYDIISGSTYEPVSLGINKLSFILRKPVQSIAIKLTRNGGVVDSGLYIDVDHIKINKQYTAQINVTKIDDVRISFTEPQIEPCSTATPYTPYEGDTYTVDLGEEYGGGYVDWARGVFVKEWEEVVLDGTENWHISNKRYCMRVAERTTTKNRSTKCSHFVPVTGGNSALIGQDNCSIGGAAGIVLLMSNTDKFQNVDIFKSWLAAQYAAGTPVKLVYKLETPVEHPITPTLIKSLQASDKRNRYKLNNIFSNTNLPTQVKFKGVAEDVNIYDTA